MAHETRVAALLIAVVAILGVGASTVSAVEPVWTGHDGPAGRIAGLLGDDFVAVREKPSGELVLQVTGGAGALDAVAVLPRVAAVKPVPLGRQELRAAQSAVIREAKRLGLTRFGVWTNPGSGSVVFAGGRLPGPQALALRSAAVPATLRIGPRMDPRFRTAGHRLRLPLGACSSGFDVGDTTVTEFFGLTAGHCGEAGDEVLLPTASGPLSLGTLQGSTRGLRSTFSDSGYFGPIPPEDGYINAHTFTANQRQVPVNGYLNNRGIHRGTKICFSGATTGRQTCGPVVVENIALRIGPRYVVRGNACVIARTRAGDSGGPVYKRRGAGALAAGLISSGTRVRIKRRNYPVTCFTKIADALRFWNLVILRP